MTVDRISLESNVQQHSPNHDVMITMGNRSKHFDDSSNNNNDKSSNDEMALPVRIMNGHVKRDRSSSSSLATTTASSLKESLLSSPSPPRVITTTTTAATHQSVTTMSTPPFIPNTNYWIAQSPIPRTITSRSHQHHQHQHHNLTPAQINQQLRLNLGLSFLLQPNHKGVRRCMAWLDAILFAWWEHILFGLWKRALPLPWRQALAWNLWKYVFLPLHKLLLGKSTGLHPSASYEFHALTTLMYFGRFVPNTVARMRFALSQVCVIARPIAPVKDYYYYDSSSKPTASTTSPVPTTNVVSASSSSASVSFDWNQYLTNVTKHTTATTDAAALTCRVEQVRYDMKENLLQLLDQQEENFFDTDYLQDLLSNNPTTVQGAYVHVHNDDNNDNNSSDTPHPVILWLYGGAFLAGDVEGNLEHAKYVGMAVGCDIMLPHYRLVPEVHLDDQIWDTTLSYRYLTQVRKVSPNRVFFWGISSGAGLALRLLQNASWMIAAAAAAANPDDVAERESSRRQVIPDKVQPLLWVPPPPSSRGTRNTANIESSSVAALGVVLLCPFVDYTEAPEGGSFLEYAQHDLIVNQSVLEVGLPYLEQVLGDHEARRRASPLYGSYPTSKKMMKKNTRVSFPPVCIVVGEHETVYDQTMQLVEALQDHDIDVTVGVWKYMFHVFCMIYAYLPEGEEAMQFCLHWIVQQKQRPQ